MAPPPESVLKLHNFLKCLSKCHVIVGLVMLILGAYADVVSHRAKTVRLHGVIESCAIYFLLMGIAGICGAASHRRGLIITFFLMGMHAIAIFVPTVIITSSFDIHFYNQQCFGECDWHLLSAYLPKDSKCQILCGANIDDNQRLSMNRLGTDYRLDAGIIALACIELFISIGTTVLCAQQIFGFKIWGCNDATVAGKPSGSSTDAVELAPLQTNSAA
uniref:Tetraspanin n=1 Tax=Panagrellus redivivus TaxID=6233 RepID=A0A7E4VFI7_PANRE